MEGLPCAGKSAVIAELKRLHLEQLDAERSMLVLSNRYTAAALRKGGKKPVKRKKHLDILEKQRKMLSRFALSGAGACTPFSLHSQGFFFVIEQFHLYHADRYQDDEKKRYRKLEKALKKLHTITIVLIADPETLARRLRARNPKRYRQLSGEQLAEYLDKEQANLIRLAAQSRIPTYVIQTDARAWTQYAQQALGYLGKVESAQPRAKHGAAPPV